MPSITIKVPRSGLAAGTSKVEVEGHGFEGSDCKEKMKKFVDALGDPNPEDKDKADFVEATVEEFVQAENG